MNAVYELIYEDLTHLGGAMGTEYTTRTSLGLFRDANDARVEAQANYDKHGHYKHDVLEWVSKPRGWKTGDMGFVQYHVERREIK